MVFTFKGVDPWCLAFIFFNRDADITVLSAPESTSILITCPLIIVLRGINERYIIYITALLWRRVITAAVNVYFLRVRIVDCRRRRLLVLVGFFFFLLQVVINLLSSMIVEMMHSRTARHFIIFGQS